MINVTGRTVNVENARILFRNFAGRADKFNAAGNRNFCVVIDDPEIADYLTAEGWNVKTRPPREDGDDPFSYLPVSVRFDVRPPEVIMYNGEGDHTGVMLDEESISCLDYADIANIDLVLTPYNWETATGSGVKAYLKAMYVTKAVNYFAEKYGNYRA